jgi:cytochrome b561
MSALNPSRFGTEDSDAVDARFERVRRHVPSPSRAMRRVAFWTAVALPFLYVPLLVSGVATSGERGALVLMLAFNVVSLYAGHGYDPD